jgi:crotonobetainyl-CoA:carnitine CoA-transferase CaiB-like acyl-CoA transferase
MNAAYPLNGLKVVALEQAVAAPFATCRLADAGAEVIKVERPEGDFARGYDKAAKGESSYFVWLNRGKTSLVLDLRHADDRARLTEEIASADVFVQNLKPGAAARLGFDPAELCKNDPRLICCSISGFADDGPLATRKAYDLLIQAESGLASITGGPESAARVGVSIVDIATGATAHSAILEALIGRGIHGKGADIRVSMFDVMADWMTVPLLNHEAGNTPKRLGLAHPSIAPYGVFDTNDGGQILLSIQSEREWAVLCRDVLGDAELATDPRFNSNVNRCANRAETDAKVAEALGTMNKNAATAALAKADIAFAVVNDLEGLSQHPELRRQAVMTANGTIDIPAPAAKFLELERDLGPVPDLN